MRTLLTLMIIAVLSISVANAGSHKAHGKQHATQVKSKHKAKPTQHHSASLKGIASEYHPKFQGRKTASGERYDRSKFTAAHKTLPMNSMIMVTNLKNGKHVKVRINDRGPHIKGRVLDMSGKAADVIALNGIAPVSYTIVR